MRVSLSDVPYSFSAYFCYHILSTFSLYMCFVHSNMCTTTRATIYDNSITTKNKTFVTSAACVLYVSVFVRTFLHLSRKLIEESEFFKCNVDGNYLFCVVCLDCVWEEQRYRAHRVSSSQFECLYPTPPLSLEYHDFVLL